MGVPVICAIRMFDHTFLVYIGIWKGLGCNSMEPYTSGAAIIFKLTWELSPRSGENFLEFSH